MSDNGDDEPDYMVHRRDTTSSTESKQVTVKAPDRNEAQEMFDEVWDDAE